MEEASVARARVSGGGRPPREVAVDDKYRDQIARLREECAGTDFLSHLFGITWPPNKDFVDGYYPWAKQRSFHERCGDPLKSRWVAEWFLSDNRLEPLPWMAASMGMKPKSLRAVLPVLPNAGLRRPYELYPDVIDKSLSEDLVRSLKGLRFRTFGTHNSYCTILHGALKDATGVTVEPWYCATSLRVEEYERQFASTLDSITLEGLSVKHSVWLDLGKPMRLAPDRCSKLFYAENRAEMRGMIAGTGEPEDLAVYLEWLAKKGAGNG
jgi:hypothetical protein